MRCSWACLVVVLFSAATILAGEKTRFGRYKGSAKTQGVVLLEVWGQPEQQAAFGHTAAISPDGKYGLYASGGGSDGNGVPDDSFLTLWDVVQGRPLREVLLPKSAVTAAALSSDAKFALTGMVGMDKGKENYALVLWDLATGKKVRSFSGQDSPVSALSFSDDGTHALAANSVGPVRLWDLEQGKAIGTLKTPENSVVAALALLSGGTRALTSINNEIHLWDLAAGKSIRTFKGHQDNVIGLAVSRDGKRAVSAGFDMSIRLWNVETGKELGALKKDPANNSFISVAFADEGRKVLAVWTGFDPATGTQERCDVCLWDGAAKKELWSYKGQFRGLVPIHVPAGGKQALLGGGANPFVQISLTDGMEEKVWGGPKSSVTALAVTGRGQVLSAGQDGTVTFWEKGLPVRTLRAHADAVNALALTKDGQFLLTASADKTIKLWDLRAGTARKTFIGHTGNVTGVAFGPGLKWLVSGSSDRTLKIWDTVQAKEIETLTGHAEGINALALAPDASWVASAGDDNTVRLWPFKEGKTDPDRDPVVLEDHTRQATTVAFSPDGKYLLSGSQDKTIKLWDVNKGKVLHTLAGHENWISALDFLEGGQVAVSASDDLTVRQWDVFKGTAIGQIDLSVHSDCPRCLARLPAEPSRFLVGTSGWVILKCERTEK